MHGIRRRHQPYTPIRPSTQPEPIHHITRSRDKLLIMRREYILLGMGIDSRALVLALLDGVEVSEYHLDVLLVLIE